MHESPAAVPFQLRPPPRTSHPAGSAACVVPVYIAEVAPYASRGGLAYLFQVATTAGILAAQVKGAEGQGACWGRCGCAAPRVACFFDFVQGATLLHPDLTPTPPHPHPPDPPQLVNYGAQWVPQWGWRLSLGLAALPASILCLGGLVLPESPSYLIEQ